ncbi:hypothetical protein ACI65C_003977 [Semiaphis heraclei]
MTYMNGQFAAGKFKDPHNGKRQMDVEWAELASSLNEMGAPKSVEQWKKRKDVEHGRTKRKNMIRNYRIPPECAPDSSDVVFTRTA